MPLLDQKVALITGAKGGLGSFVTEAFLQAGAAVVGVSRSIQASDFPDPRFVAMPAELSSGEAARQLASVVAARFERIDILVHLVGGFAGGKPVHDRSTWRDVVRPLASERPRSCLLSHIQTPEPRRGRTTVALFWR